MTKLMVNGQVYEVDADGGMHLPPEHGRGLAVHKSFGPYVAEVSMNQDGTFRVEKMACAMDCGTPSIRPPVDKPRILGLESIG